MASGNITDSQIQVSSETSSAPKVRLSDSSGWAAAALDSSPWIRIQIFAVMDITGVITKGGPGAGGWVKEYQLAYTDTDNNINYVKYNDHTGTLKVRNANESIRK